MAGAHNAYRPSARAARRSGRGWRRTSGADGELRRRCRDRTAARPRTSACRNVRTSPRLAGPHTSAGRRPGASGGNPRSSIRPPRAGRRRSGCKARRRGALVAVCGCVCGPGGVWPAGLYHRTGGPQTSLARSGHARSDAFAQRKPRTGDGPARAGAGRSAYTAPVQAVPRHAAWHGRIRPGARSGP